MFLSEHRSKEVLSRYGLVVPDGRMARTAEDAERSCAGIEARKFVVKAQIPAGGRGLAGGVRFAATASQVGEEAAAMLGSTLITEQTGPGGEVVETVYVEAAIDIARSVFIAIALDPESGQPLLLASAQGGVEFEQRARMDATTVKTFDFTPDTPDSRAALTAFLAGLAIDETAVDSLYAAREAFMTNDMALLEINPFAKAADGRWMVLDAKITIDANAAYRRPEFSSIASGLPQSDSELRAQKHNINLVKLGGTIGVIVNGAGLGLATNDMLVDARGNPANFMDIRTTATSIDVARGVEILLEDPQVKAILLNIHGGGMTSADTVAEGVIIAYARSDRKPPISAHISGQNADWGISILKDRKVPAIFSDTISGAVARAVDLSR